jgi:hypothetical protein
MDLNNRLAEIERNIREQLRRRGGRPPHSHGRIRSHSTISSLIRERTSCAHTYKDVPNVNVNIGVDYRDDPN